MSPSFELFTFFFQASFIFFIIVAALLGWTIAYQFHIELLDLRKRLGRDVPENISIRDRFVQAYNRVLCLIVRIHLFVRQYRTARRIYTLNRKAFRFILENVSFW